MKKRIIISESEKKTILGLYGLLKEDVNNPKYKIKDTFKNVEESGVLLLKNIDSNESRYNFLNSGLGDKKNFTEWDWSPDIDVFENDFSKIYVKITKQEYDTLYDKLKKSAKKEEPKNNDVEKETPKEKTSKTTKNDSDESITISGIVKQGTIDGKKGVVDATVTIEEKEDENNSKSVETDGSGGFKVILPYVGKYKVTVVKKGFQSYSKTFNFNDDVNFNIPLTPKKGIIPNIKRKVQNIIDKLKDYYDTRDPKEDNAILFGKNNEEKDKEIWENSESQQEYCRNFTEHYFNFVITTNYEMDDVDGANRMSPDDEKLNQAKNFIMFCKKQYGNKLFASSIETKRKFDKIFATLQNLPPKVKRYQI